MKRCTACKQYKRLDDFNVWRRSKDGRQDKCRQCCSEYFAANRDKIVPQIHARKRQQIPLLIRHVREYLLNHPCVDCGERDPVVLEFDHVRGEKKYNISDMPRGGFALSTLKAEIEKCDVRCANCHRRRTAESLGRYAALDGEIEQVPATLF